MSDRSGSRFRRLGALLALAAIAFSAALVYAPGILPPGVVGAVRRATQVDPRTALLFVGAVAGVVGLLSLWVWRAGSRSEWLADVETEEPEREATVAGRDLTEGFERRRAGTGLDGTRDDGPIADVLHDVLVDVYARERGDREAATRYVDEGRWTDDRYAAAFVTKSAAVDYPLYFRLLAWLYPGEAYEYRTRRALREVEAACEAGLPRYEAPDRSPGWRDRLLSARRHEGGD